MKWNCGEQELESICDQNISKQICDESICELFANYTRKENYSLNTGTYYPEVPAVVGTTSSSDMTNFEASGGCCIK